MSQNRIVEPRKFFTIGERSVTCVLAVPVMNDDTVIYWKVATGVAWWAEEDKLTAENIECLLAEQEDRHGFIVDTSLLLTYKQVAFDPDLGRQIAYNKALRYITTDHYSVSAVVRLKDMWEI